MFIRQNGKCYYCKRQMIMAHYPPKDPEWKLAICTRDHVRPKSRGGKGDLRNLVGACVTCNSMKGDMHVDDFMAAMREPNFAFAAAKIRRRQHRRQPPIMWRDNYVYQDPPF